MSAYCTPAYRPDIDGLRALAILPVVIYHAFPPFAPGGFIGVDIFFVISGYLISSILFRELDNGKFAFSAFYGRRIRRLFPALLLMTSACYGLGWLALLPDELQQLGKHIAAGLGFVQNIALWREAGYFDVASAQKPLMHLWSLAVEEQFYLAYPLLIWLAWKLRINIAICIATLCAASFWISDREASQDAALAFFLPHTRFWELMLGALLAWIDHQQKHQTQQTVFFPARSKALSNIVAPLGLTLIVYAVVMYRSGMPYPGARALVPALGAALLIFAGPRTWINRHLLSLPVLTGIGLISYPLYLWHWPLLAFLRIIEIPPLPQIFRIAAVALSFVLAALTYRFIEKPIRHGTHPDRNAIILCLFALMLGGIGYYAHRHNGLGFRIEANAAQHSAFLPENASWFTTEAQKQQCREWLGLNETPNHYCSLTRLTPPTIQLIGDSHAASLAYGLHELFRRHGQTNLAHLGMNGCQPFPEVFAYPSEFEAVPGEYAAAYTACQEVTNKALEFAEKHPEVHTVILAGRWPLYLQGSGFIYDNSAPEEEKVMSWNIRPITDLQLPDRAAIWAYGLRSVIRRLLAANKNIIFILDYPELGFDPKTCIDARPLRFTQNVRRPCAIPRADFDRRSHLYRELVRSVLEDFPSVSIFDAATVFCDPAFCWADKEGQILYFDDDHLSRQGSLIIAEELFRLINGQQAHSQQ